MRTTLTESELENVAKAFWGEYILWSWRAAADGTYEITRSDSVMATANGVHEAKSEFIIRRRLAAAQAILKSGEVVPKPLALPNQNMTTQKGIAELLTGLEHEARLTGLAHPELESIPGRAASAIRQLLRQREHLLPLFLDRYRYVPERFLEDIVAGHDTSPEISADLALAILTARNLCTTALTES